MTPEREATGPPADGPTSTDALPIDLDDVHAAAARLSGVANTTPVLRSRSLDAHVGARVHLKGEHLQRVGAFKFRGAYNAIALLPPEDRARGIAAYSSGNHAQAVACAAALLGAPATIVMPEDAPTVKLAATRGYGAEVVTYDRYTEDRLAVGERVAEQRGATLVPPFDHADVIAGQGTAALELVEAVADLDVLVVPVSGGGLIAGCAVAAKGLNPRLRVLGVEPAGRWAARSALERDEVVTVDVPRTVLDGQQTPALGKLPFAIIRNLVDEVVGVEDDAVLATVRTLALRMKQVVEPSGASGLAAVLDGAVESHGGDIGVILSGGNIAPRIFAELLGRDTPLRW